MALASAGVTRIQSEFAVDVLAKHVVGPQLIVSPLIGVLQSRSEGLPATAHATAM
jgi:hypothetical protein